MALSGVFITWGFANVGQGTGVKGPAASLLSDSGGASEAMATTATSVTSAPTPVNTFNRPVLSIAASAAIYFTIGSSVVPPTSPPANATSGPAVRYYDPASGPLDILVNPGDKMAWILA